MTPTRFSSRCMKLTCLLFMLSGCSAPHHNAPTYSAGELRAEQQAQYQQAFDYQLSQQARLAEVAYPLLKSAISQCRDQHNSLGIILHSIGDYPEQQRSLIEKRYATDQRLQVLHTLRNGPSVRQLLPGDKLIAVNGHPLPLDNSKKALRQLKQALQQNETLRLQIDRDHAPQTLTLNAEPVCDTPVSLRNTDQINGYADGSRVIITAGMMRFAQEDNQLALIIAHEMVHNYQGHIPQRLGNAALGSLIDLGLLSSGIFSPLLATGLAASLHTQAYEIEADLLALPLLQQAGYEIRELDRFWQQMAQLHPGQIEQGREISHPTTAERALLMRKEIDRLTGPFATAGEP